MHITINEAIAILDSWTTGETLLDVHVSRVGHGQRFQATVVGISGTVVCLSADGNEGETELDLTGASFNGDRRASPNSIYGAYLVCEHGNGDFWSFYAPRPFANEARIPPLNGGGFGNRHARILRDISTQQRHLRVLVSVP